MSEDLFSNAGTQARHAPLAEQLRQQTPDDVIGQQHLLGAGKPLRLAFESGQPHSMILWGPPGVGKTTLARMMATQFQCEFIALSAVFFAVSMYFVWRSFYGMRISNMTVQESAQAARSAGTVLPWKDIEITVEDVATADFSGLDIALFLGCQRHIRVVRDRLHPAARGTLEGLLRGCRGDWARERDRD